MDAINAMLIEGIKAELVNYAAAGGVMIVMLLAIVGLCTVVKAVTAR